MKVYVGTANWGKEYGINKVKVSPKEIDKILGVADANDCGIETAWDYNCMEALRGLGDQFDIIFKGDEVSHFQVADDVIGDVSHMKHHAPYKDYDCKSVYNPLDVTEMEDDVEFDEDCRQVLEVSLDELCDLDYDMIYFGGNILRPFYQVTKHWARLSHCQSTHCMAFNKKFLPTVVGFLENNSTQKTGLAIDQLYADWLVPNCRAYIIIPMIARQRSDFSTIENREMTYDLPVQRYWHYLVRQ